MTALSLIPTKINLPRPRADVVNRPRVLRHLNESLTRPLTLISAPAGYGKTTLVVDWLRGMAYPHAWYSLEAEDDNLPRFSAYLLFALNKMNSKIGRSALQLLESASADSLPTDAIFSSLIHDVAKTSQPILLVLEDYHVIESQEIHEFVERLMEHAQPHLHVIITTRHDPPLPLARWRVRNQLIELRTADLQFTLDEAAAFLGDVMQLTLDSQRIHQLEQQTEGWVAGLQLAGLSIRNHQSKQGAWSIAGVHRNVADYLMTEVIEQLPATRREFLYQTSILNRLNAGLCNAVTQREDGQRMLETLEADNLFTLALDEQQEWFRYHHLFAEFLSKRLKVEYSENTVWVLHGRAARWLEKHGSIPEAIDHALTAHDFNYAACLIKPQCEQWMRYGEVSAILKALNQLPPALTWDDWGCALWYGWAYAVRGELELAERWVDRLDELVTPLIQQASQAEGASIPIDLHNAYVQILGIRSSIARRKKDYASAIAFGEQALQIVREQNPHLKSIISATLTSAMLEAGRFDDTESILRTAREAAYRVGNPFIMFSMLTDETMLALMRGQYHRAHKLNLEAMQLAQANSMEKFMVAPQFRLGRIHYVWNRLSEARECSLAASRGADPNEAPSTAVLSRMTLAQIQNAEGEYTSALQTLAEAETIATQQRQPESAERVSAARAQIQLWAGEEASAFQWAKTTGWESFRPDRPSPSFNDEAFFLLCQLLIAHWHQFKRAEQLLAWRLADSRAQQRDSTMLKIYLLQGLLHQTQNQNDLALAAVLKALELAQPENVIRPFLDEGRALLPLLRRVPQKHAARGFAQKILANHAGAPEQSLLAEPLNEHELRILQLMAQGYSNPEIARQRLLAVSTVRWYVKHIFRKLGVHNRTQAATQARKLNLL